MAIIKCKMCGGDLAIEQGNSVAECEYCGTTQTVHNVDDEKKITLFARANRLRASNEFDKASGIYESIVADFPKIPRLIGAWCFANMVSNMLTTLRRQRRFPPVTVLLSRALWTTTT